MSDAPSPSSPAPPEPDAASDAAGAAGLPGVSGAPEAALPGDEPPRPNVVVSQCLGFAAVRYDGQILKSRFVEALRDAVNFMQVCPEVGMGLGVPRDPIRIEVVEGERRLIQPSTGRDLTDGMRDFSDAFLGPLRGVDGFILKSKSPSCGLSDTKIYAEGGESGPLGRGPGLFAEAVRARFPWAAIRDEGRLTNLRLRHHFLTHLWSLARLRRVEASGRMRDLVRFHSAHKFLLMAYGQEHLRRLGRLVANPEGRPVPELVSEYRSGLGDAMAEPAGEGDTVNALQHVFGYVSDELDPGERGHFDELLADFRAGRLQLPAVLSVLRSWVVRFREPYLEMQRFFEPYPRTLFTLSSSGDARLV